MWASAPTGCVWYQVPAGRYSMVRRAGRRPRAVSLGPLGQFTFCGHRPLQGAYGDTNPTRDGVPIGGNGKAAAHHPVRGGDSGFGADAPGIAPSADGALDDWEFRWLRPAGFRAVRGAGVSPRARGGYFARARGGCFARCGGRPGALPPGPRDFGLPAVRWQEWSARNFASGQGVALQPYWMYGKKPHRRHGGKGPASTADTRTVGGPHKKKIE